MWNSFNLGYFYSMIMIRTGIALVFIFLSLFGWSQLTDDFSDGDFSQNPSWSGDTQDFIINDNFLLQLDADGAGESFLYNNFTVEDSIEWNGYFRMDFNPSSGNNLKIYLGIDNIDLASANGYFLEIGEDGTSDAISFGKLENGIPTAIASASMGAVATDPAQARYQIKKSETGQWILNVDYNGGIILSEELSFIDNSIILGSDLFFGFYCTYTSTRSDKFFFDDIDIRTPEQDLTAPTLVDANLISPDSIVLTYNELLAPSNTASLSNVGVDNGIGSPASIIVNDLSPNRLEVKLSQPLISGTLYTICSMDITDLVGNASVSECKELFTVVSPVAGDIYINEILFNPYSGGSDFLEIINTSDKFLSLDGIIISNSQNSQSDPIEQGIMLLPGEIIAFTKDPNSVISDYNPIDNHQILEQELPSFNADEGNASLLLDNGSGTIVLDSFDYSDDLHFPLIDDVKGVSLEKLVSASATNADNSWYSAAETALFATPGYRNSNNQEGISMSDELVNIPQKVFSPNGDGDRELLAIQFNLPNPGYISNVKIFTDRGFLVKNLSNNMLLGLENTVYWDGITDEGTIGDIGIYVVLVELFDDQGNKSIVKKTAVLADFID